MTAPSPPLPIPDPLLKPEAVAKWLQCSRAVIYAEAKSGRLPCVIVGDKLVRFEREAIQKYIQSRRRAR